MKNRKAPLKNTILTMLFCISLSLVSIYLFLDCHEATHQQIYSYFNVNSTIHLSPIGGETIANSTDLAKLTNDQYLALVMLHSIVEAIGYQLIPIFVVLFVNMILMFFIFFKMCKISKEVEKR